MSSSMITRTADEEDSIYTYIVYTYVVQLFSFNQMIISAAIVFVLKGELNLYNNWQSDDLFHIVINENHPHGNRF